MPAIIRPASQLRRLTPTEKRVAEQIAAGRSNLDAARELGIQPGTLSRHVSSIGYKFGATSRPAMIHAVLASGQITTPQAPARVPDFTTADLRLLQALATHSENEQIAAAAGIAPTSVHPHVRNLVAKASALSPSHLVGLGHAWGLLGAPIH